MSAWLDEDDDFPVLARAPVESPTLNGHDAAPDLSGADADDWTLEVPPDGMQARTGHAVRMGDPAPTTSNALDWPVLYERGEPPARRWAEPGWIGFGHITLLVGSGGIGKTLIAQQWGSCFAIGRRLLNGEAEPLRTLMWACEDDHDELWRRQLAIAAWHGGTLRDYDNLTIVPRAGLSNALVTSEFGRPMLTPLIETLRAQADAAQAHVVILDNAAQLYGAGENDRHAVTYFINALTGALRGRAVLLLAHPSKSAGSEFSGSTAWEAAARTRLYLGNKLPDDRGTDEPSDENQRFLSRRKSNYSSLDYRRMTYTDGVLHPEAPETHLDQRLREEGETEGILAAFRACATSTPPIIVPSASTGNRTAYHVLSAQRQFPSTLVGGNKAVLRRFWRCVECLRQNSRIIEQEYRRPDRHMAIQLVLSNT